MYVSDTVAVGQGSCLLVFSDGVYEVPRTAGLMGSLPEFMRLVEENRALLLSDSGLDVLLNRIAPTTGDALFIDDYSVIKAILT